MAAISQTTFPNAFSWMKILDLDSNSLKFVPKPHIDNKISIGLGNGLAPNRRQAINWINNDPVHRRIYASSDLNWLKPSPRH